MSQFLTYINLWNLSQEHHSNRLLVSVDMST